MANDINVEMHYKWFYYRNAPINEKKQIVRGQERVELTDRYYYILSLSGGIIL